MALHLVALAKSASATIARHLQSALHQPAFVVKYTVTPQQPTRTLVILPGQDGNIRNINQGISASKTHVGGTYREGVVKGSQPNISTWRPPTKTTTQVKNQKSNKKFKGKKREVDHKAKTQPSSIHVNSQSLKHQKSQPVKGIQSNILNFQTKAHKPGHLSMKYRESKAGNKLLNTTINGIEDAGVKNRISQNLLTMSVAKTGGNLKAEKSNKCKSDKPVSESYDPRTNQDPDTCQVKSHVSQLARDMGDWLTGVRGLMAGQAVSTNASLSGMGCTNNKTYTVNKDVKKLNDEIDLSRKKRGRPTHETFNMLKEKRKDVMEIRPYLVETLPNENKESFRLAKGDGGQLGKNEGIRNAGFVLVNDKDEEVPINAMVRSSEHSLLRESKTSSNFEPLNSINTKSFILVDGPEHQSMGPNKVMTKQRENVLDMQNDLTNPLDGPSNQNTNRNPFQNLEGRKIDDLVTNVKENDGDNNLLEPLLTTDRNLLEMKTVPKFKKYPSEEDSTLIPGIKPTNESDSLTLSMVTVKGNSEPKLFVKPEEIVRSVNLMVQDRDLGINSNSSVPIERNHHSGLLEHKSGIELDSNVCLIKNQDPTKDVDEIEKWSKKLTDKMMKVRSMSNSQTVDRQATNDQMSKHKSTPNQQLLAYSHEINDKINHVKVIPNPQSSALYPAVNDKVNQLKSMSNQPPIDSNQATNSVGFNENNNDKLHSLNSDSATFTTKDAETTSINKSSSDVKNVPPVPNVSTKTQATKSKRDLKLIKSLQDQWSQGFKEKFLQMQKNKLWEAKLAKNLALTSSNKDMDKFTTGSNVHMESGGRQLEKPSNDKQQGKKGRQEEPVDKFRKNSIKTKLVNAKNAALSNNADSYFTDKESKTMTEQWLEARDSKYLNQFLLKDKLSQSVSSETPIQKHHEGHFENGTGTNELLNSLRNKKRIDDLINEIRVKQHLQRKKRSSPEVNSRSAISPPAASMAKEGNYYKATLKDKSGNNLTTQRKNTLNNSKARSPDFERTFTLIDSANNDCRKMIDQVNDIMVKLDKKTTLKAKDIQSAVKKTAVPNKSLDGIASMTVTSVQTENTNLKSPKLGESVEKPTSGESLKSPMKISNLSAALGIKPDASQRQLAEKLSGEELRRSLQEQRRDVQIENHNDLINTYKKQIRKYESALEKYRGKLRKFEEKQREMSRDSQP